jgi:drug/metabolite transporter (DMT)-like permease
VRGRSVIVDRVGPRQAQVGAIVGAATISVSAILVRAAEVSPSTAAIFRCLYAVPALALLARYERTRAPADRARRPLLAAFAGAFLAVDLISWHHSIADVGAGLATVLGNAQVALIPVVAWLVHGERPSRRLVLTLPLAVLGILLVSGILGNEAYGRHPLTGTMFGAITAVTYSCFILLLRASSAGSSSTIEPLLIATTSACIVASGIGALVGDARFVPTWPSDAWLVLLALSSQVLGWVLIARSLPRLPAAMTSLALTIQPVGAMILAALLFGEDPDVVQLIGAAMILFSLTAISGPAPAPAEPAEPAALAVRGGASAAAEPAAADVENGAADPVAGPAE